MDWTQLIQDRIQLQALFQHNKMLCIRRAVS